MITHQSRQYLCLIKRPSQEIFPQFLAALDVKEMKDDVFMTRTGDGKPIKLSQCLGKAGELPHLYIPRETVGHILPGQSWRATLITIRSLS